MSNEMTVCHICNWSNTNLWNLGNPNEEPKWTCQGCCKRMLDDSQRWKYPSKGELPDKNDWYLVTTELGYVEQAYWHSGTWRDKAWEEEEVRAWRELPREAPEPAKEPEGPPEAISEG